MKTSGEWLEGALGYTCRDPVLLEAALTHRSAGGPNNERLEFLGDAVLNCVVEQLVFREFASAPEGELSRFRASLVSGESLAVIAAELGLGERLKMGSGELKSGGFRRKSMLADGFEALLGAIYLDGGFDAAARVIETLFLPRLDRLPTAAELKDPKTRLQEALQARGMALPVYAIESIAGEAHNQLFRISCRVDALGLKAEGEGPGRRRAEQEAAQKILGQLGEPIPQVARDHGRETK